jgi:predicted pyridoxine 5'-phosphate oxidase superfamily flavin-nucleotide-binding protein
MVKLTDEMKEDFAKMKIFPFATASKDGEPNVIPIGMCNLQEDGKHSGLQTIIFIRPATIWMKTRGVRSMYGGRKLKVVTR